MHLWKSSPAGVGARRRRASLAAAVGLLALIAAEPAAAQFFAPPESIPGLPPGAVRRLMAERGFRVLTPPFRRGDVYIVDAVDDRDGRQIRIIVGAYQGRILQTFAVGRPRVPLQPGRPVAAEDRLPFPGESAYPDDGRGRRGVPARGDNGGLFGMFGPRPADPSDRPAASDPSVVPGVGPQDTPRPHRVARPKPAAPKTIARGAPPPLPGPKTIPATADSKAVEQIKPAPAIVPAAPKPAQPAPAPVAKREPPAIAPPALKPTQPAPAPVAKRELPPVDTAPKPKPAEARAPAAPAAPRQKETQAGGTPKSTGDNGAPPKVSTAKKRTGPLNDIPPAPLD